MIIKKYVIDNNKKETIDKFLSENQLELFKDIVKAYEYCYQNDLDSFEAFIIEPSDNTYLVYRNKYNETLNKALKIFEKVEDYETCSIIVNLKNNLKKGKKKK